MNTGNESIHVASKSILYCSEVFESKILSIHKVDLLGEKAGLIYEFIIPHVNSPYKTSIDERLIFYNITRCYSDGEYCHSFAITAGDIIKYQSFV